MSDDWQQMINTMQVGDCRDVMNRFPARMIQMVGTSPPYWGGLRDYGIDATIWGGKSECVHSWGNGESPPTKTANQGITDQAKRPHLTGKGKPSPGQFCIKCGAWLGCLGMEPSPQVFVDHLVEVFQHVRRILRDDGVVFLNIGDTYVGNRACQVPDSKHKDVGNIKGMSVPDGLKPKDMALVPERLKIALQDDGWYVRSTIIWEKPNALCESVKDRPTTSHEYIIMLTKRGANSYWSHRDKPGVRAKPEADYVWTDRTTGEQSNEEPDKWRIGEVLPDGTMRFTRRNLWRAKGYYWDFHGIKEPYTGPQNRWGGETLKEETVRIAMYKELNNVGASSAMRAGRLMRPDPGGRNRRSVWTIPTRGAGFYVCQQCDIVYTASEFQSLPKAGTKEMRMCLGCMKLSKENATHELFISHYSAYPEALIEPMIIAASSDHGCPRCGSPWERIVEPGEANHEAQTDSSYEEGTAANRLARLRQSARANGNEYLNNAQTVEWRPTCDCPDNDGSAASIVLDPFAGTGTTCVVSKRLRRRYIGIDAGREFTLIGKRRLDDTIAETEQPTLL